MIASGTDADAARLAKRSLEEILRAAVVQVGNDQKWWATGFVVAPEIVATADYAAHDQRPTTVRTFDGVAHPAELVGIAADQGLAVLRVAGAQLRTLRLHKPSVDPATLGQLTLLGSTEAGWRLSVGRIEGVPWTLEPTGPQVAMLRAKIPAAQGQGGAPIVDRTGQVVAMDYVLGEMQGFADGNQHGIEHLLPVKAIWAGLARFGVEPQSEDSRPWDDE